MASSSDAHKSGHVSDAPLGLEKTHPIDADMPYAVLIPFDAQTPKDFTRRLETGVKNGDCLPACLAVLLECMHKGYIIFCNKESAAARMRHDITAWIKENWLACPLFNQEMAVHELMWMQHDMGITSEEREQRGEWPEEPDARLAKYTELCDTLGTRLYFSDTEMLMFASWFYEKKGIPLCFRIWRCTGRDSANGELISHTPDLGALRANGIQAAVMIDMAHNGRLDGWAAHYKVIESGSVEHIIEVKHTRPPRRRLLPTHPVTDERVAKQARV